MISVCPPPMVTPSSSHVVRTFGHDRLGQFGLRAALRKEHDDEEPQRACAQDGNVVRVDVNSVTPDVISGKGNGICRDDEIAIAFVDDGRVLANLRSNEQARIMLWQMPQQRSQMLKRKFADWKNLLRLAASHALTFVSSLQVWTGIVLSCGGDQRW